MKRILFFFVIFLCPLVLVAEELVLKDGTKIVGKMTAIHGDTFDVETAYGTLQVKRSDIVSIGFPENDPDGASKSGGSGKEPRQIEESLNGTNYTNKTGSFTLTVPEHWNINPEVRKAATNSLAALSSNDEMYYVVVVHEAFPGSLDSYKGLVELQSKGHLQQYEKVSESATTVDGRPALLMTYRGLSAAANNLPIQFLTAIVTSGNGYTRVSAWCVMPLFNEAQASFEKILRSYHEPADAAPPAVKKS
jgi:hypothetical protein